MSAKKKAAKTTRRRSPTVRKAASAQSPISYTPTRSQIDEQIALRRVAQAAPMARIHYPADLADPALQWDIRLPPEREEAVRKGRPVTGPIPFLEEHVRNDDGFDLHHLQDAHLAPGELSKTRSNKLVDEDAKAIYWDPFALTEQMGYRDRTGSASFATLAAICWRMPVINDIIQTYVTEVSEYCTPAKNRYDTGFRIKLRDNAAHPKSREKKEMDRITRALLNSNTYDADSRARMSFEGFMRQLTRDSLMYDQKCAEIVSARNGKPAEWFALDATTIRLANTTQLTPVTDPDEVFAVQLYDDVVVEQFTRKELAWGVRNPRTSLIGYGYGIAESEMIISAITYMLWGFNYNANFFKYGSSAKGLLNLVGQIPETQMRAFRRQFYNMLSGVENSFRTPVTNVDKLEWINMHQSNRDMEFSLWLDFLIKLACAAYAMDPAQINFKYGNTGGGSAFAEGSDSQKAKISRARGLHPLLRSLERFLNINIINQINDDFEMEFVGFNAESAKERADLDTQRVRSIWFVDEVRAEQDKDPLPDGLGQVILDANWMNEYRMVQMKKDQKEAEDKEQDTQLAHAAAMAALPESEVSDEELAHVVQMLIQGNQAQQGASGPGAPPEVTGFDGKPQAHPGPPGMPKPPPSSSPYGSPGGPGGGRAGTAPKLPAVPGTEGLPKPPNPELASGSAKLGKSFKIVL